MAGSIIIRKKFEWDVDGRDLISDMCSTIENMI